MDAVPAKPLLAYLQPLAAGGRSLPAEALRYVAHGDNPSFLLAVQGQAVQQAWRQKNNIYPVRDQDRLFADLSAWRPDQMRRLGEIVATLAPITYDWGFFGTKKSPDWLRYVVSLWISHDRQPQPVAILLALTEEEEESMTLALDILFCRDATSYGSGNSVARFSGVDQWMAEGHDAIAVALPGLAADVRAELAAAIGRFGLHQPYLDLLIDTAIGSSKKARRTARQALTGAGRTLFAAALDGRFAAAPPGRRVELVDVAATALGDAAGPLLHGWRTGENNPKVIAALDRVAGAVAVASSSAISDIDSRQADGPTGYQAVDGSRVTLEAPEALPGPTPLSPDILHLLEPAMQEFNQLLDAAKAEAAASKHWHWSRQYSRKDGRDLKAIAELAEGRDPITTEKQKTALNWMQSHQLKSRAITDFFDDPRLSLYHLVRLAVLMSNGHFHGLFHDWSGPAGVAMQRRLAQGADLRTVLTLWKQAGGEDHIGTHLTRRWYWPMPDMDAPIWPLLCMRFRDLDEAMGLVPQSGAEAMRALPAFDLLEQFPKLPERYRGRLMLFANDSAKQLRDRARALLRDTPDLGGAIALQLQDGRQETRALAADWLAARNETAQMSALRAALKKERSDLARAAMITALERLGEDVSPYFDPDLLMQDARAGLAKPRPKGLDWFPFDQLPALHWADGSPVDPVLPSWWVVLSTRLKQPGGNALMGLWLDRLAPGDAHRLGWMILTGWIEKDTRTPSDEEANAYAVAHVDATLQQNMDHAKRWPQSADYFPTDRDLVFSLLKRSKAGTYLDSASDSKGMLALAARVSGADAAQRVRAFIKDHGQRTSQAKALLEVLAAIGTGAALQAILAAANRSKQRSVQAHAAMLVEQIAERNGWSAGQLADRTIPTGGFERDGTQDLECGENRTYRLQLDAQDAVIICNAEGREVKSLPGARVDAEKPLVDAAKKQLASARKEVKQVLAAQNERLQEAMYLQRVWDVGEWENFIAGHPIVGRLAARLIWQGIYADGVPGATFRPLGDGSLSDVMDNDMDMSGVSQVRLAHSSLLDAGTVAAWRVHLTDYVVISPFDQLGRDLPTLEEGQGMHRSIADREGWMIETFKLRGAATRLGYQRGQAQDGGWFLTYEKSYRDAGLVAEIEFSGRPLPEENRASALQSLCFRKLRSNGGSGGQVALADVPPVLLAESWRDLHDIADKGSGFDPEWKKKVY